MLGKTNAVTGTGGGSSGGNTYGVKLACEYMQNLLDNNAKKADVILLDVLSRGGKPVELSGKWTYKAVDFAEHMQNILTSDDMAASLILDKVITGTYANQ